MISPIYTHNENYNQIFIFTYFNFLYFCRGLVHVIITLSYKNARQITFRSVPSSYCL